MSWMDLVRPPALRTIPNSTTMHATMPMRERGMACTYWFFTKPIPTMTWAQGVVW